jgi:hypothetical protein
MAAHPVLYAYLWFAPHVLLLVLAVMMVRRQFVREFPAFFAYAVYEVVQFIVLYTLARLEGVSAVGYKEAWLVGLIISCALRFAIIMEIFRHVFANCPALKDIGNRMLRWATAIIMILSVTVIALSSGNIVDRLTLACTVPDRVVSAMQCGLLLILIAMSRFFGIPRRSRAFGIAVGLGVFAATDLAIMAIQSQWGLGITTAFFALLSMAVYHICVLVWMVALLVPQRQEISPVSVPAHNLDHWTDALQQLLQQ